MFKAFCNWLGLLLISKENKRKIEQRDIILRHCDDVYFWCGSDLPQVAEAVEFVRTRTIGYENRAHFNERIMSPQAAHTDIARWREAMRDKYLRTEATPTSDVIKYDKKDTLPGTKGLKQWESK